MGILLVIEHATGVQSLKLHQWSVIACQSVMNDCSTNGHSIPTRANSNLVGVPTVEATVVPSGIWSYCPSGLIDHWLLISSSVMRVGVPDLACDVGWSCISGKIRHWWILNHHWSLMYLIEIHTNHQLKLWNHEKLIAYCRVSVYRLRCNQMWLWNVVMNAWWQLEMQSFLMCEMLLVSCSGSFTSYPLPQYDRRLPCSGWKIQGWWNIGHQWMGQS